VHGDQVVVLAHQAEERPELGDQLLPYRIVLVPIPFLDKPLQVTELHVRDRPDVGQLGRGDRNKSLSQPSRYDIHAVHIGTPDQPRSPRRRFRRRGLCQPAAQQVRRDALILSGAATFELDALGDQPALKIGAAVSGVLMMHCRDPTIRGEYPVRIGNRLASKEVGDLVRVSADQCGKVIVSGPGAGGYEIERACKGVQRACVLLPSLLAATEHLPVAAVYLADQVLRGLIGVERRNASFGNPPFVFLFDEPAGGRRIAAMETECYHPLRATGLVYLTFLVVQVYPAGDLFEHIATRYRPAGIA